MIFRDARRDELSAIVSLLADDILGRAMIGWAIEEARRSGCGLVQLTSDKRRPDAIRFYQALGFAPTHEGLKLSLDASAGPGQ
jgi:hypothetical protein